MNGNEAKRLSINLESVEQELGTYWWKEGQEQNKRIYTPIVPDLSKVELPPTLKLINEILLAPNTQAKWAMKALSEGQTYENNDKLVPYHMLTKEGQEDVARSSALSLRILIDEGYQIELTEASINAALELREELFTESNPFSQENQPSPVDVSIVLETKAIRTLSYPIAHYQHEDWSRSRLSSGWKFGIKRDNGLKLHPMLKPTEELNDDEIAYDLIFALYAVKLLILLGARIYPGLKDDRKDQIVKLFKVS